MRSLHEKAKKILRENDRGGYTVPTAGLYPYQWNWDSAFVALGFAAFDLPRAWREIETLFDAQWSDGLVPHIVFRVDDPNYFPGPSVWRTGKTPETSGISQPPVAASVVRWLWENDKKDGYIRAKNLYPKLLAWHRWFHKYRDPLGKGLVLCTHPWESGRDNSPEWDKATAAVDISKVEPYQRRDTEMVDMAMRPSKTDYDRYIAILQFGRECGWDHDTIAKSGPFRMFDVGMTLILLRANRDLLALAEIFGSDREREEIRSQIELTESNIDYLWSDRLSGFCSRDAITDEHTQILTSASFLSFYAGVGDQDQQRALCQHFDDIAEIVKFTLPSLDPRHEQFDPILYWRGPIWAVINKMVSLGFSEYGLRERADRIVQDTRALVEFSGFYESYCPMTGRGTGGPDFSWTAAMWLHMSEPDGLAPPMSGAA